MSRVLTLMAMIVAALFGTVSPASAAILTVNPDGSAAFTSIGAALTAAQNGDVILISPGSYNESVSTGGKNVTLRGANGATQTSLDRLGASGTQLTIAGGTVTVEGITFRNGRNASMVVVSTGANATFIGCRWIGGIASEGAALTVSATATFQNCQFLSNRASSRGGVIRASGAVISASGSDFQSNQCTGTEGGVFSSVNSNISLSGCSFVGNSSNSGTTSKGGAIFFDGGTLNLSNCNFTGNSSSASEVAHGGAIWAQGMSGSWSGCVFTNSLASASGSSASDARGGDCYLVSSTPTISTTTFTNSEAVVERSSGGTWTIDAEGGSLWCGNNTTLNVSDVAFAQTRARGVRPAEAIGGSGSIASVRARGGAVHLQAGSTASIVGTQFTGTFVRASQVGSAGVNVNCNTYGGAVFVGGASPLISNCTFVGTRSEVQPSGNQTGSQIAYGGAIYLENLSSPTILSSSFVEGVGQWGGAIYCTGQSSPFVSGSVFRDNMATAQSSSSGGRGGAIYANDSAPSFAGCLFQQNTVSGGVFGGNPPSDAAVWGGNGHAYKVVQTALTWNAAQDAAVAAGGHLATITSDSENSFVHSLIPGNGSVWLGGLQQPCNPQPGCGWTWVTGEPWSYTRWSLSGCNSCGSPNQPDNGGGSENRIELLRQGCGCPNTRWNDLNENQARWYVIEWSTPAVTVSGAGGAFFVAGSAGFFPQIGTSTFCGNGDETIAGSFFNNGGNVFLTDCGDDCNGNGLDDTYEIAVGLASDCNQNGVPDACEIAATPLLDCNGNGVLDVCEGGTFSDCDGSGVPDECKPDCNGNGIPDPCEILAGLGTDCNGNGVLDACDIADGSASDCDGAGLPDECKTDCDGDGLPDGCELLSDPSLDCDGDGTLDGCAIAADPSLDVNNNGVLDSCEGLSLTGIEVEIVPITGVLRTEVTPLPLSAVCYRIYATFDGPAAQVVGVYGSPEEGPLALQAQQGFYSDPLGGGLASSRPCDPKGAFPELRFDSFVTVGGDCALNSSEFAVGIDFSTFLNGGALQSSNGMVLVTPDESQGYAGQQGRVLIAQLTSRDGSIPEGQFNLIGFNADGSQFEAYAMTWGGPSLVDCNDNGQQDAFDISTGASLDCNRDGIPDECQTDDPTRDCNMNGLPDWCDIADGTSLDLDFNGVPDECECSGDLNGDSLVNVDDILIVILAWGDVGGSAGDANGDGLVDALDLALVITAFGGCL